MIGGKIVTAKFPERGIEIADVDHITSGVAQLDPIADAVRRPHQNVDPADETRKRSLQSEAGNNREHTQRNDSGVPVNKEYGNGNQADYERGQELENPPNVKFRDRVVDALDQIDVDAFGGSNHRSDRHGAELSPLQEGSHVVRDSKNAQVQNVVD